jgi:aryl-alcohol dehydrogenase-like predicted oxidoreductase
MSAPASHPAPPLSRLGDTDLMVSRVCLGTMTFGEQNSPAEAHAQLDLAVARGVNFIDMAEIYPVPPRAETFGATERIVGEWLRARGGRDRLVLATKAAGRADWLPHVRDGAPRLNRAHLEAALEGSLKRLGTDHVDLYQLHWPDRNTNYFGDLGYSHRADDDPVPVEETLAVLGGFVKAGKVRHVGLSNETPWGVMAFLRAAERAGLPRVVSVQNPYSLLNRTFEIGLAEVALRERVGLLAYSPLGFGVLTGKYLKTPWPKDARLARFDRFRRYSGPAAEKATAAYAALARRHGLEPAAMALAFVARQPFLTSVIVGATSTDQLARNLDGAAGALSEAVLEGIEAIHRAHPNPCP